MAGRPPKPTALKKLEGTFRDDRVLKNEMMPAKIEFAPSAPTYLSRDAKREWKSVCNELIRLDMLHGVDLPLLSAYCQEMSNYIEAEKRLRKEGRTIEFRKQDGSKYSMPSPWISIKNSALKNAQGLASQFGFTPAARTKIAAEGQEAGDPFEKMLEMDDE